MENNADFYDHDPYTIELMKELEVEKERVKNLEIELANAKRQKLTGKDLLLEVEGARSA